MTPKNDPIKRQVLNLGDIMPVGAVDGEGLSRFQFWVPTHRIHYSISVGWTNAEGLDLTGSVWSLEPVMVMDGGACALQPVKAGAPLPDGYEGESSVRLWRGSVEWLAIDTPVAAKLVAIIEWEPADCMNAEEWSYWAAQCRGELLAPAARIGVIP
jgi:hypothetical protein